ncbi:DUF6262 family protein [Sinomonas mesophila]|uniref:DUF6262 family protein n=1 Tax=Sinomonas mesophila TaxID=1531955 RepID=UPI0011156B5A|nr:DUF6262 family protein [Sinomonas mesophila]
MAGSSGVEALRAHRRAVAGRKKEDVARALLALSARGDGITVSSVARQAGVSREYIHSHPEVHAAVREAAKKAAELAEHEQRQETSTSVRAGAAQRLTLVAEIKRLRGRLEKQQRSIDELHVQRRRWLGAQVPDPDKVDPAVHAELRSANERLLSEKADLLNTIGELRRVVGALEYDLAACREALTQHFSG